jgi:hypothetical protein
VASQTGFCPPPTEDEEPSVETDEPKLLPGMGIYYRAWWDLDTERQRGDFPGPIPWSAVRRYAISLGYRGSDRDHFIRVIRRVDVMKLQKLAEEMKRESDRADADRKRSQKWPTNGARGRNARR